MKEETFNEVVPAEVFDVSSARTQNSALLDGNMDNILYLAQKAEQYVTAMKKIMTAALAITTERDWVLIGGNPYLQESGATKVARLFGISIQIIAGYPVVECDAQGYKTFTYKARFMLKDQYIECEGSRSSKEDFFAGKDDPQKGKKRKLPDEIDERDVKMAAYTNCLNNGIKRLIPGLRNIAVETLENAGLEVANINGYIFKPGSKGGNGKKPEDSGIVCEKCGKSITQKVASFAESKFGMKLCMECQSKAAKAKAARSQIPDTPYDDPEYLGELPPF